MITPLLARYILTPLFILALSCVAIAETQEPPQKNQIISFVLLPNIEERNVFSREDSGTSFSFESLAGRRLVQLSPGLDAGPYLRKAAANLDALRPVPNPETGNPDLFKPVARAEFPKSWINVLILVSADSQGNNIRMRAFDQSFSKLPESHLGLVNFTPTPVSIKLGEEVIVLEPNEQGSVHIIPREKTPGAAMFAMLIAIKGNEGWELETSTRVALDPSQRRIALIYPGQGNRTQHLILYPAPSDPIEAGPPVDMQNLPPSTSPPPSSN